MKELLVTLLSYVPSSNPYYKHLINNSTDEERSNKCVFILFDFCSTSTDATDDCFFHSFISSIHSNKTLCRRLSFRSQFLPCIFIFKPKYFICGK